MRNSNQNVSLICLCERACVSSRSSHKRPSYSTHSAVTINTSGVPLSKLPLFLIVVVVCAIPPTKHCQTLVCVCAIRRKDENLTVYVCVCVCFDCHFTATALKSQLLHCCYFCSGAVFMVVCCCYHNLRVSVSARCRRRCAYLQHII